MTDDPGITRDQLGHEGSTGALMSATTTPGDPEGDLQTTALALQ